MDTTTGWKTPIGMPSHSLGARGLGLLLLAVLLAAGGCESEAPPSDYVARVGDEYLTQSELNEMMGTRVGLDTSQARKQIIEQWVTRTLLHQEALDRGLQDEPEVRERLQEQRRTVLVTALTNRLHEGLDTTPSQSDVRAYFERHRNQLRLREPYLRVRFLTTPSRNSAELVRERLAQVDTAVADSVWRVLAQRHASVPDHAVQLSDRFYPESRILEELPTGQDVLPQLDDGAVAPVLATDSLFHVLQVVKRFPTGTDPKLAWVRSEIRRRLTVRARKQMYAREVQRLRNEAKARNALEIR